MPYLDLQRLQRDRVSVPGSSQEVAKTQRSSVAARPLRKPHWNSDSTVSEMQERRRADRMRAKTLQ